MYDTLNMLNFDVTKKCLVGEGWCPVFARTQVLSAYLVLVWVMVRAVAFIIMLLQFHYEKGLPPTD